MRRGFMWVPVVAIVGAILAVAGVVWVAVTQTNIMKFHEWTNNPLVCTIEEKLCPDGSSVGRTGPNCAFAECPSANTNAGTNTVVNTNTVPPLNNNTSVAANTNTAVSTVGWRSFADDQYGFSFKYPTEFAELQPTTLDPNVWSTGVASDASQKTGEIVIEVKNAVYDPNKIMGLYGQVEASRVTAVKLGSRGGSMYIDGDAGCGSAVAITNLTTTQMLKVSFADCSQEETDTRVQLYTKTAYIKSILATFVFGKVNTTAKTFTSPANGLSFLYGKDFKTHDAGQTIYVYAANTTFSSGQYVKMYEKAANITLAAAIKANFLSGYAAADCYVTTPKITKPAGWTFAQISFKAADPDAEDPWANAEKCPAGFTTTNGIAYFAMDPAHPTKYYFFSIGQYSIPGSSATVPWQDTIKAF